MHEPKASALSYLDRYCIILVHTLKHVIPEKCGLNNTYIEHVFNVPSVLM